MYIHNLNLGGYIVACILYRKILKKFTSPKQRNLITDTNIKLYAN